MSVTDDQLTPDQRLRLEALAQAVAHAVSQRTSAEGVVWAAKTFERYIRGEQEPDQEATE